LSPNPFPGRLHSAGFVVVVGPAVVVVVGSADVVLVGAAVVVVVGAAVVVVVGAAAVVVVGGNVVVVVVGAAVVVVGAAVVVVVGGNVDGVVVVDVVVVDGAPVVVVAGNAVVVVVGAAVVVGEAVVVVEPSSTGEKRPTSLSDDAPGADGNESTVLIVASRPAQPGCAAGIAGITNVLSTIVTVPVTGLYGTPPGFAVLKFSEIGPSGQSGIERNGIARFVVMLPPSVMAPVSGFTLPVKSEFAIGLTVTSSGSGSVTCVRNESKTAPAWGKLRLPEPSTVPPVKWPVIGPS
jgi:hypothetical protein